MRYSTSVPGPIGRCAHHGGLRSAIATALAAATLSACVSWQRPRGSVRYVVAQETQVVRVHLRSGQVVQIYHPSIASDSLTGTTEWQPSDRVAVAIADVRSVEVQRTTAGAKTALGVVVVVGLVGGLVYLGARNSWLFK